MNVSYVCIHTLSHTRTPIVLELAEEEGRSGFQGYTHTHTHTYIHTHTHTHTDRYWNWLKRKADVASKDRILSSVSFRMGRVLHPVTRLEISV